MPEIASMGSAMQGKIASGAQGLIGLYEQYRAGRIRKQAQAKYDADPYRIPGSITSSVNKYASMAQGIGLPGQAGMEDRIKSNAASTVGAARQVAESPSQVLASTLAAYQQQQQDQQNLDINAAQNYQQRQQQYASAIQTLAPYEQKRWEYRSLYPYQASLNQAAGMQQQGQQNMQQGIQGILSMSANEQYSNSLNTNPTNGMTPMQQIKPIAPPQLQWPQQQPRGLMPMQRYDPNP